MRGVRTLSHVAEIDGFTAADLLFQFRQAVRHLDDDQTVQAVVLRKQLAGFLRGHDMRLVLLGNAHRHDAFQHRIPGADVVNADDLLDAQSRRPGDDRLAVDQPVIHPYISLPHCVSLLSRQALCGRTRLPPAVLPRLPDSRCEASPSRWRSCSGTVISAAPPPLPNARSRLPP